MLILNQAKYQEKFSSGMTYSECRKEFGQIPLAEYLLMVGMEAYRERSGRSKAEVVAALWTQDDAKDSSFVPPAAVTVEVSRGLGDTIAKITSAVGLKQCGGCKERQKLLNELVPYGRG